jgi:hypothetical protein
MWGMRKVMRVTVVLMSVFVLAGSILAHSAHSFPIPKDAKAIADVTDAYTFRAASPAALASRGFTLAAPDCVHGPMLAAEAAPSIDSTGPGVPTSRAPPRES